MGKCGVMSMWRQASSARRSAAVLEEWLLRESSAEREHRVRRRDLDRLDDRLRRDRALHRLLFDRHALGELLVDELAQRYRIEELDHLGVQAGPQVVRHAAARVLAHAVFLAGAARRVDRL